MTFVGSSFGAGSVGFSQDVQTLTASDVLTWSIPDGTSEIEMFAVGLAMSVNEDLIGALIQQTDDAYASFDMLANVTTTGIANTSTVVDAALFRHTVVGAPNKAGFWGRILDPRSTSKITTSYFKVMSEGAGTTNEEFTQWILVGDVAEDHDVLQIIPGGIATLTGTIVINYR